MTVLDTPPPPSKGATVPLGLGEVLAGKYRVEKLIGAGGMGLVVLATHLELDTHVAIKLMREEALKDAEARARFAREAKAVVRLRSEHVARVTDVGTLDDGAPFLVMEYLQGNDLGAVLTDIGKLPPEEAVAYLLQICEGMAEAHGAGIIHRDLKPRNIFVTTGVDGAPLLKILDFGISKLVPVDGGTLDLSLTKTTDVMGSPSYMAPEQLRSARDADERSDIWSLGVMLYELVTGRLPWEARSLTELGAMVLRDPPDPMITHCPDVSPELDAVVAHCLEKDPAKRYPSVVDLAHALEPHARGLAVGSAERVMSVARTSRMPPARASSPGRQITTNKNARTSVSWGETEPDPPKLTLPPPDAPSPRRVWLLGALLAVVVLAAGGSLFVLRAHKTTSTPPVLPDDRGAVRPPSPPTPPASVAVAELPAPAPPPTGTASATAATIATIPRHARAAPSATLATPSTPSTPPAPPSAPSPAPSANAHDMGAIPRK